MNNSENILDNLTSEMVEDMIVQFELMQSTGSLKVLYAIDTYDLINYCYPLGARHRRNLKYADKYYADQYLALHHLFTITKPIILDEYLSEVENWRLHFEQNRTILDNYIDYTSVFENEISKLANDKAEQDEKTMLPLLLSLSLGMFDKGYKKFKSLLESDENEEHLITSELDPSWLELDQIVQDVFKENHFGDLSKSLFKSLVTKRLEEVKRTNLQSKYLTPSSSAQEQPTILQTVKELESRVKDCQVADRLITINNKLENLFELGILTERYLVLYVSSTELNRFLFNEDFMKAKLPECGGRKLNFLRNAAQLFLLLYCEDEDPKKVIEKLKNIHTNLLKKDSGSFLSKEIPGLGRNLDLMKINRKIKIESGTFEYETLILSLNQHTQYQKQIAETIKSKKWDEFRSHFNQILRKAQNNHGDFQATSRIQQIKILRNGAPLIAIKEGIDANLILNIKIEKGQDIIEGRFQHFPLLFFVKSDDLYRSKLRYLTNFVTEYPSLNYTNHQEIQKNILTDISYLTNSPKELRIDLTRELYVILISLILASSMNENSDNNFEELVFLQIRNSIDVIKAKEPQYVEFLYLGANIGRRQKEWDVAINYCNKGKSARPQDPRFPHALALINYNLYCERRYKIFLDDALIESYLALKLYQTFKLTHIEDQNLIDKLIGVVRNNIAYFSIDLFVLTGYKDDRLLIEARTQLDKLKTIEGHYYQEFSEYLHTEAILELHEYLRTRPKVFSDIEEAAKHLSKIFNSFFAIQTAVLTPNLNLSDYKYGTDFEKIEIEFKLCIRDVYAANLASIISKIFDNVADHYQMVVGDKVRILLKAQAEMYLKHAI